MQIDFNTAEGTQTSGCLDGGLEADFSENAFERDFLSRKEEVRSAYTTPAMSF